MRGGVHAALYPVLQRELYKPQPGKSCGPDWQPVRIYFDVEDVRLFRMFDVDGRELCVVEVQGAWRHTARTLGMCREILALVRERKLRIVRYEDPVQYLRKHAGKRRRSASNAVPSKTHRRRRRHHPGRFNR
jgi:hypothetical protein